MIEICPAGPPKLMKPNFNQKANACQKLTAGGVVVFFGVLDEFMLLKFLL